MKLRYLFLLPLFAACGDTSITEEEKDDAPIAKVIEEKLIEHNHERIDNYFWMRLSDEQKEAETPDQQTQDVLDYLNAENAYLEKKMKHTEPLQEKLFEEIKGRIKPDDSTVPVTQNGYIYYSRYEEGQDYALYCRRKDIKDAGEEIMLNGPELAGNAAYFELGDYSVSPNNKLLVYTIDHVSRREYTIYFKNLMTGEILSDKIENTTGGATWANDNKTIFYTRRDPVTLRSYQIFRHEIGTPAEQDVLVFEEEDETFYCDVYKTKSQKYLMIGSWHTLSSEYRYLDASNPSGQWKVIEPREMNHEYQVDHFGTDFFITTNWESRNFRLMKTPVGTTQREFWTEVIPSRPEILLEGIEIFQNFLVLQERNEGLTQLRIIRWDDWSEHVIQFDEKDYYVSPFNNYEFKTDWIRFDYTSLATPWIVYDYNMSTKEKKVMKQQEVMDPSFSSENYVTERVFAKARDGVMVPVSIVYHKDTKKSAETPLLLYAYGSYGYSIDPTFRSDRLSLLDRGFVYAIAHIRGGQEMGRHWYEDGKLLKKKNTFYDFIDCAHHLIDEGYTSPKHLYAMGGSAGGLLMGGIVNMEPGLWNGVIAAVPFVDVVSTMLDETIPLTTFEFDEWGNPKDKEYYDYMLSYSPYDNVEVKDYPNMLVTTGYWDSQVQYWEPAKWVAKLRAMKTDNNLLLLHCNMDVGHGGASGRFEQYRETAMEYAFMLDLEGITE